MLNEKQSKLFERAAKMVTKTNQQLQAIHNARMEETRVKHPEFYKEYIKQLKLIHKDQ